METFIFLVIIITHWIGDFIFQTDEDAKGKSTSMTHLYNHTISYIGLWFVVMLYMNLFGSYFGYQISLLGSILFLVIQFITHTGIDYITSRINSKLWANERIHDFFVSIGFDQVLHYIILWFSFKLIL